MPDTRGGHPPGGHPQSSAGLTALAYLRRVPARPAVLVGGALFFAASFLPWYAPSDAICDAYAPGGVLADPALFAACRSSPENGWGDVAGLSGWLSAVLFLAAAVLCLARPVKLLRLPVYLVVAALVAVGDVLFLQALLDVDRSLSRGAGMWIGLVAAVLATVGAALELLRATGLAPSPPPGLSRLPAGPFTATPTSPGVPETPGGPAWPPVQPPAGQPGEPSTTPPPPQAPPRPQTYPSQQQGGYLRADPTSGHQSDSV